MAKRPKYPSGVRVRSGSVQINLYIEGTRKYITTPYPATPKGISDASKLRTHLISLKKWGALTQQDVDQACKIEATTEDYHKPLFADYAQLYLDTLPKDANRQESATRRKYRGILKNKWMPFFAAIPIADITPAMVRSAFAQNNFNKPKTANDALTPLRGVFDLAFIDEIIDELPTKRLRNQKIQHDEPDPFLPGEREKILEWMRLNWIGDQEIWYLYVVWQFWTGCRPGETLAVDWADVNTHDRIVKISKTLSNGRVKYTTKTNEIRNVHLNDKVMPVIARLKELTGHQDRLFISLHTGEPWTRPDKLSEKFQQVLQLVNVRVRPAYNCRHTYATVMLNSMIDVAAAAYQMGHDIMTFKTIYAKWLNTERMAKEMHKLDYGD